VGAEHHALLHRKVRQRLGRDDRVVAVQRPRSPRRAGHVGHGGQTPGLRCLVQRRAKGPELASGRSGTPFLEGPTVTVAGAALLQRVANAVSNAGGTIQSSQVDILGTQAKDGFVGLLISCEMEQPALQKLLYDLEVGMPFLFVDQLDVQVPQTTAGNEAGVGKIRVVLGVSGQWQGNK